MPVDRSYNTYLFIIAMAETFSLRATYLPYVIHATLAHIQSRRGFIPIFNHFFFIWIINLYKAAALVDKTFKLYIFANGNCALAGTMMMVAWPGRWSSVVFICWVEVDATQLNHSPVERKILSSFNGRYNNSAILLIWDQIQTRTHLFCAKQNRMDPNRFGENCDETKRSDQRMVDSCRLPFDTKLQWNVDPCENHNVRIKKTTTTTAPVKGNTNRIDIVYERLGTAC